MVDASVMVSAAASRLPASRETSCASLILPARGIRRASTGVPTVLRDELAHERGEAHAVGVQLTVQALERLTVPVVHDRAGLETDAPAAPQDVDEDRQVLATTRGHAGTEDRVEPADGVEGRASDRPVGAGAVAADAVDREVLAHDAVRVDRLRLRVAHHAGHVVRDDRHRVERALAAEAAVVRLVPDLRRGGEFDGKDHAGHRRHLGLAHEAGTDRAQPLRVDAHVVVGEGDHLALCRRDARVPPGRAAGAPFDDEPDVAAVEQAGSASISGSVTRLSTMTTS